MAVKSSAALLTKSAQLTEQREVKRLRVLLFDFLFRHPVLHGAVEHRLGIHLVGFEVQSARDCKEARGLLHHTRDHVVV